MLDEVNGRPGASYQQSLSPGSASHLMSFLVLTWFLIIFLPLLPPADFQQGPAPPWPSEEDTEYKSPHLFSWSFIPNKITAKPEP